MSSWLQEEFYAAKSLAAMLKLNNSAITSNFLASFSRCKWDPEFSERNISPG